MNAERETTDFASPRSSLFREASEVWKQRDYPKAIEMLTRASELQPTNARLFLNLGEAHGLRFNYPEAEHWLDKAVMVSTNKAEALADAGRRCQRFGQPGMAHRYLARAADRPDVRPEVLVSLAEIAEGSSRIAEARTYLERALWVEPDCASALVARARLHRVAGELEEGERLLRLVLARTARESAVQAWYELGTNLDRQGSYDRAMEAFLQAKALLGSSSRQYDAELRQAHAEIRKLEGTVSASRLNRWLATGAELQPIRRFALLCGHPRSGTTLLEHVLDAHSDIIATDESSVLLGEAYPCLRHGMSGDASMSDVLESASLDTVQRSRAEYFRLTESFARESIGDRLLIDKNPALDVHIPVVVRLFPEARFLVAIRDPRDVCLSCFMLPLPPGRLGALYLSLEATAAQYALIMGASRSIRSKLASPQMEVRYEDLVADLEGVSRRVLRFLGVEWNPMVLRFDEHARTKRLRCAVDESVSRPVFTSSVGRWRRYQKYLEPCFEQLDPFVRAFGYD